MGVVAVPLLSLSFMQSYEETLTIMSYEAETVGRLNVSIIPCDASGNDDTDMYDDIEDSVDLVSDMCGVFLLDIWGNWPQFVLSYE